MAGTLLIMAAGMGSRYGGDKQIDRMGPHGEILMEYTVHDALAAGFDRVVFVIRRAMDARFREMAGDRIAAKCAVRYAYQEADSLPGGFVPPAGRVKPYGTVHAVLCARKAIDGPFAVVNADDYYGRDAFAAMSEALGRMSGKRAAMVAYDLGNTVSAHGTVTRGICEISGDGLLRKVTETYKIGYAGDGSLRDFAEDAQGRLLNAASPVSMNFWGFTPWFFDAAEKRLTAFLRRTDTDPMTADYVLPTLVDELMREEGLPVEVLHTHARWFGVTYRQDKPLVAEQLKRLHEAGIYPERL